MRKPLLSILSAALVATSFSFAPTAANADPQWRTRDAYMRDYYRSHRRDRDYENWRRGDWDRRDYRRWYRRHHDDNDAAVAALFGLAAGALITGAITNSQPAYRPSYRGGEVPYAGGYAPGSPGYMAYCDSKYRSFNPDTFTYTGYDGRQHYCQ